LTGTALYVENAPPVAIAPLITVADLDSPTLSHAIVAITNGFFLGEDILTCTSAGPISCPASTTQGSITLTGAGTPAEYQAALRLVGYSNTSDNPAVMPRTIEITVFDAGTGTQVTRTVMVM